MSLTALIYGSADLRFALAPDFERNSDKWCLLELRDESLNKDITVITQEMAGAKFSEVVTTTFVDQNEVPYYLTPSRQDGCYDLLFDNRRYEGVLKPLPKPFLVCTKSDTHVVIHARLDRKVVFASKPKFHWAV